MSRPGFSMESRAATVGLIVLAVLVTAGAIVVILRAPTGADQVSESHYVSHYDELVKMGSGPEKPSQPKKPSVLVIGDSFTAGSDMNTGPEWPAILSNAHHLDVQLDAVQDTGYLAPGPTKRPFASRLAADASQYAPDVVLVAGGRSDVGVYPEAKIAAAAGHEIDRIRKTWPSAEVVLFSSFASGTPSAAANALTAALSSVAQRAGVDFLDVSHMLPEAQVGADGVHPTEVGQHTLARQIYAGLRPLGVLS